MLKKLIPFWLCILCLVSELLCGCSSQERAEIVIINGAEPESLDPAIITGQPDIRAVGALFSGLTAPDPKTGLPVPCLAESWEISPDGKTYTFHLRPGIRWSTGQPITAHDFAASWIRLLKPETAANYANLLFAVEGAEDFNAGRLSDSSQLGIKALDDNTFQVTLRQVTAYFLDLCSTVTLSVVPIFAVEESPDQWIRREPLPVSGPYCLEQWRLNDKIRLRKNPLYWDAENTRNELVDLLPIGSSVTALNLYYQGEVDLLWDKELIPSDLLPIMLQRPDVHSFDYLGNYFARINVTKPPLNNPLVRKALSMAIDREALVERVSKGGGTPVVHFTPNGCANYDPPEGCPYDPARARQLLAQAGYPNGKDFPVITYLFNAAAGGAAKTHQKVGVELQQMWKENLHIQVDLQQAEWKVFLSMVSGLDYDICRASWVGDYNDATTFLNLFISNSGNNRTGWKSKEYDDLIATAEKEVDLKERAGLLKKAETLLIEEAFPVIPLYVYKGVACFDTNKIEGYYPNPVDRHPINALHKKKGTADGH